VQKLTGRLASLNRFISRSAEKSLPFFKVLKGTDNFHWGTEQDKAFEDLKKYLENLVVTASPSPGAELLLYIATSSSVVSAALVEERMVEDTLKQLPIYFVSEALNGSKFLYSEMEKMAYVVVMQPGSFTIISRVSRSKSQHLFLFGTCLRTERPQVELGNGQHYWHHTPLILSHEAQSSLKSWLISLLTGHRQHLHRTLQSLKQFGVER